MRGQAELRIADRTRTGGAFLADLLHRIADRVPPERARLAADLAGAYVRRASAARFDDLDADEVVAQIAGLLDFVDARRPGETAVRVFEPARDRDGWHTEATVVEVNVEDAPFLVDSVREELRRHGLHARLVVHPVVAVERDGDGRVTAITPPGRDRPRESLMHLELDRRLEPDEADALRADLVRVLGDVRRAVRDFPAMADRLARMQASARGAGARYGRDEIDEAVAFLEWLGHGNFVFLGYREYQVDGTGDDRIGSVVSDSGLGILSDESRSGFAEPVPLRDLPAGLRARIVGGDLLTISKTNSEATVHRRARMDYVGVKRVGDDGEIVGELRMVGLFTSKADREFASRIPVLRRKLAEIVRREDLFPGSHDHKGVVALFESFPKTELFLTDADELHARVMALLEMQERRQVRVFAAPNAEGRTVTAMVALPRDHLTPELREGLERLLLRRFAGDAVETHVWLGDEEPARIHFLVHVPDGEIPDVRLDELAWEVGERARTWDDRLEAELVDAFGEVRGRELAARFALLFPDYYKSATPTEEAARDVARFVDLAAPDRTYIVALENETAVPDPLTRLKLYKLGGKAALTDFLPVLEDLGLKVVEEIPTRVGPEESGYYLHDIGVLGPNAEPLDQAVLGDLVAEAVRAVWEWRAESDGLNRLVVAAALSWRQVAILRALRQYRQELGTGFSLRYQNDAFVRHAAVARKLAELFDARFDPAGGAERDAEAARLEAEISADLDATANLDDDRILRGYLGLVLAIVRTNAFVDGGRRPYLSFKVDCARVPGMPRPVPLYEIFVYSPDMEGVHLRGGPVARGGIRWSDRLEDYRTEILGLMKAQMVKNAVIVPVGAKGGFVLKYPPTDRDELMAEEREQYVTLMRGMLDVTDNIAGGETVHPPEVRVHDGPDAYLVVAADKGTAHLSDTANAVSAEYGFWLDDAYASGGSSGYDHKKLGITAKGAWESVKRHFREMGRDPERNPFTAAGVGDMSGDVFGNGMLLSRCTKLVAAFDHRHIFLDPDPDPERSYAERARLFALPRSSWADYRPEAISPGGGVWPRTAKSVPLSEEARALLGVDDEALAPPDVVRAILEAPVDLFWNGGIGTFVKSSAETNADVGDRANDAIRIDGRQVRARVVGEGGNLGFTQLGRIEYAAAGGRINTDAIDNSAGVDSSDHEVNLKILLRGGIESGDLTLPERNALLEEVAGDVVAHVLYDNYLQVQILSQEAAAAPARMEAYEDLMAQLERQGMLDRELESLPASEEMAERRRASRGLVRPELAVLLAYAKRLLREQVLKSALPDDPFLERYLAGYFPARVAERFPDLVRRHPLRREITATIVTNDIVNSMGVTFVTRLATETGAAPEDIARAYVVAREVSDAHRRWDVVERLDGVVQPAVQTELMDEADALVEHLARWYLLHRPHLDLTREIERGRPGFEQLAEMLAAGGTEAWKAVRERRAEALRKRGVPPEAARAAATTPELVYAPDVVAVAEATGRAVPEVAHGFFVVGQRLYLDAIEDRVAGLPARSRWQRLAFGTMVDDLRLLRRQIVERVLAAADGGDVDGLIDDYLAARVDPYERLAALMESPSTDGSDEASLIMVVVHQIRQVVSS